MVTFCNCNQFVTYGVTVCNHFLCNLPNLTPALLYTFFDFVTTLWLEVTKVTKYTVIRKDDRGKDLIDGKGQGRHPHQGVNLVN